MSDQLFPPTSPISTPARRTAGPAWNTLCAAVVGLLVIAYVGACVAQIYVLNRDASDVNSLAGLSASTPEVNETVFDAHVASAQTVENIYQVLFWAMFIAFFGWNAIVRSKLREIGLQLDRRSSKAWLVWRIGLIVSLVMVFIVPGTGSIYGAEDRVSGDHRLMIFFGVRAIVGIAYLWVTFVVWNASAGAFAMQPARPAAPAYQLPEMQQSFPQAPHAYQPPMPPPLTTYQPPTYQPPTTLQPPTYQPPAPYQAPTDQI